MSQAHGRDEGRAELMASVGEQVGALVTAARSLTAAASAQLHPDLQPAAFHIVQWIKAFGPAHAGAIAEGIAMDKSAVSRLIRDLKQTGILRATPDESDRRAALLSITALGEKRLKKVQEQKGLVFHERLERWSGADLATFAEFLRRFNTPP